MFWGLTCPSINTYWGAEMSRARNIADIQTQLDIKAPLASPSLTGQVSLDDGSAAAPSLTNTGDTNTGLFFPAADALAGATGGFERWRTDGNGNFGVAAIPTNNTLGKALQVGQAGALVAETGSNRWWLGSNWFYNAGDKYINDGFATLYSQQNGTHQWSTAASGTAGAAITFTQAMTLDANGDLAVGTSDTDSRFKVEQLGVAGLRVAYANGSTNYFDANTNIFRSGDGLNDYMRIASGNVLVGKTTDNMNVDGLTLNSNGVVRATVSGDAPFYANRHTSTGKLMGLFYADVERGNISTNGTTVSYNTSSDYRLKENVKPMQGALELVTKLNPVTYNWIADGSAGQGFIAHELQAVVPDCVTGEKDAMREEQFEVSPAIAATYDDVGKVLTEAVPAVMETREVPAYQGVDTSFLVGILTKAIQEQQALITALTARVAALEA